ncbi:MAG: hypothetical protein AAF191_07340 [Verrucomicrobiota bacterium]
MCRAVRSAQRKSKIKAENFATYLLQLAVQRENLESLVPTKKRSLTQAVSLLEKHLLKTTLLKLSDDFVRPHSTYYSV